MKTILVTTDFSEVSLNTSLFAMEMAREMKSKLVLFHADHIPAMINEFPVEIMITPDELKSDSESQLKKLCATLRDLKNFPVEIELMSRFGEPEKEIISAAQFHKADLIMAGMRGAGVIKEKVIGSLAASLLHKSAVPVMVIPHQAVFRRPQNIVFAIDGKKTECKNLELLIELSKHFLARLHIVHIYPPQEIIDTEKMIDDLTPCFRYTNHVFRFMQTDRVDEGIEDCIKTDQIDWLSLVPRKHTLLKNLFGEKHSKHFAFHSHIPVLSLPER